MTSAPETNGADPARSEAIARAPGVASRRHVLSVLADAGEAADLLSRVRTIARGGALFVLRGPGAVDADPHDGGRHGDGALSLDPTTGECRLARVPEDAAVRRDAVIAGFPDLWMTDAQHGEATDALARGGTLFVIVARSEDAARAMLREALRAVRRRVRLHEFTARWAATS